MEWYVYREDWNRKKIEPYNVFDHGRYVEDIKKLKKKKFPKEEFAEELRKDTMYYFWSKCEHEIVLTSWPPRISKEELAKLNKEHEEHPTYYSYTPRLCVGEKIDIYDQLKLNWDKFVDYVYGA